MSKAGLGGLEVLLSSLFPAVGRSLTSGLWACKGWVPVTLLTFFFFSLLLHHFFCSFCIISSASLPHFEAGLFTLEGGSDRRCRHVLRVVMARGQDPTLIGLA